MLGLTTYLYCGFWISSYGWFLTWRPKCTLWFHWVLSFFSFYSPSYQQLPNSPPRKKKTPPSSSHSPSIYNSRWMEKSWLFLIVNGNRGPMSLPLSGCLVGNRSGKSGIGTGSHLKRAVRQQYSQIRQQYPQRQYRAVEKWHSDQSHSRPWYSWPGRAQVMDQGVQVRIIGPMGLGPSIVIRGLGPRPSRPGALLQTEGWDHGPCHRARV